MRKKNIESNPLTVDINDLKEMLGCGAPTAKVIAKEANAILSIPGTKRKLYSVDKVKEYLKSATH